MTKQFAPSDWAVLKTPGTASGLEPRLTGPRRTKGDPGTSLVNAL